MIQEYLLEEEQRSLLQTLALAQPSPCRAGQTISGLCVLAHSGAVALSGTSGTAIIGGTLDFRRRHRQLRTWADQPLLSCKSPALSATEPLM